MKKLTDLILRFPYVLILLVVGLTVFLGYQIQFLRIDNELASFIPDDHPEKQFFREAEETFGSEIVAVIGVYAKDGIFTPATLTMITDISTEVEDKMIKSEMKRWEREERPDGSYHWKVVETLQDQDVYPEDVLSISKLSNLDSKTYPPVEEGGEPEIALEVEDILPELDVDREQRFAYMTEKGVGYDGLPAEMLYTKEQAEKAKTLINDWDIYRNNIIGDDNKSTAIYVTIPIGATIEYETLFQEFTDELVAKYSGVTANIDFHVAGLPMTTVLIGKYMHSDLKTLIPICFAVILVILILSFRRFNGVFLPLLTVSITVIWVVGVMAMIGKKMTIITSALPTLILAVGSAYTIHVVHHYYEQLSLGVAKEKAIRSTMTRIGIAVVMAGLTTVGGFGSLISSQVLPIRDFGEFAALGALFALLISITLPTAILKVMPMVGKEKQAGTYQPEDLEKLAKTPLGRILGNLSRLVAKHAKAVVLVSVLVLAIFGYFSAQVVTNSNMVKFFKPGTPIRTSDDWLTEHLGGTTLFSIVLDGGETEAFLQPDNLRKVEQLQQFVEQRFPDYIRKTMSIADYMKKINKTVQKENPDEYRIPDSEGQVAENLLLYESRPETLESVIDFDRQKVRLMIKAKVGGTKYMHEMRPIILDYIAKNMPNMKAHVSGEMVLRYNTDREVVTGQKISILISVTAVLVLLIIIFRSLTIGIVCLGPIVLSILGNFAAMAIAGIPLDVGTALIAATAVGIGIDYAIHYVNRYRVEREVSDDVATAVFRTHISSGKAIIFNASAVALGYLVLTGSQFIPLMRLGVLTALTMFLAAFGTLTTLPALLMVIQPYAKKLSNRKNNKTIESTEGSTGHED